MHDDPFVHWFEALERRHLTNLKFSEIRKAVQAVSSLYVERRDSLDSKSVFNGAGKRAAFAMYYGPLHFLLVRAIVQALQAEVGKNDSILDIGCGTGVAGAAWALEIEPMPRVIGVDRNSWARQESKWTYRHFGIRGTVKGMDAKAIRIPARAAVIAAFTMNEFDPESRSAFRNDFIKVAKGGAPVLVIEPIARRLTAWWDDWEQEWKRFGGRGDEWRFRVDLPDRLKLMDRAAGLDHRELTGRSLWLPPLA